MTASSTNSSHPNQQTAKKDDPESSSPSILLKTSTTTVTKNPPTPPPFTNTITPSIPTTSSPWGRPPSVGGSATSSSAHPASYPTYTPPQHPSTLPSTGTAPLVGLSERFVRWRDERAANLKPWSLFFALENFGRPPLEWGIVRNRVDRNLHQFATNYLIISLILLAYCMITNLGFLFWVGVLGVTLAVLLRQSQDRPLHLNLLSTEITMDLKYLYFLWTILAVFVLLSYLDVVLFWGVGASLLFIGVHTVLYDDPGHLIVVPSYSTSDGLGNNDSTTSKGPPGAIV